MDPDQTIPSLIWLYKLKQQMTKQTILFRLHPTNGIRALVLDGGGGGGGGGLNAMALCIFLHVQFLVNGA